MSEITLASFPMLSKCVSPKMSLEDGPGDWTVRLCLLGYKKKQLNIFFLKKKERRRTELPRSACFHHIYSEFTSWVYISAVGNLWETCILSVAIWLWWQVDSRKQTSSLSLITLGKCSCCLDNVTMTESSHSSRQTFWHLDCWLFGEGKQS